MLLLLAGAACGGSSGPVEEVGGGAAPEAQTEIEVAVVSRGADRDDEPDPHGTLAVDDGGAVSYFWIQGVSEETAIAFRESARRSTGTTSENVPVEGIRQVLVTVDGQHRMVASVGGADPRRVTRYAFELGSLPNQMTFVGTQTDLVNALQFDPAVDSVGQLPVGAEVVRVTNRGDAPIDAVRFRGDVRGLLGLVGNLSTGEPGTYFGSVAPGRDVTLTAGKDGVVTVVPNDAKVGALDLSTTELSRMVADAR